VYSEGEYDNYFDTKLPERRSTPRRRGRKGVREVSYTRQEGRK